MREFQSDFYITAFLLKTDEDYLLQHYIQSVAGLLSESPPFEICAYIQKYFLQIQVDQPGE